MIKINKFIFWCNTLAMLKIGLIIVIALLVLYYYREQPREKFVRTQLARENLKNCYCAGECECIRIRRLLRQEGLL